MSAKSKAREYTRATIRRLDTLSGNECSAPDCTKPLIAYDGQSIISKICHIKAASKKGPRFDPSVSEDYLRSFENLILLCDECHTVIDAKENEEEYPVELLHAWKNSHIRKNRMKNANISVLGKAIRAIARADLLNNDESRFESYNEFDIEEKIKYNDIKQARILIEDYKLLSGRVSAVYSELDSQSRLDKSVLLNRISSIYREARREYISSDVPVIESVRAHSDAIFERVEDLIREKVSHEEFDYIDEVEIALPIILVDSFVRCKILEEPPVASE